MRTSFHFCSRSERLIDGAFAQQAGLKTPNASPAASVSQTVGLTDFHVTLITGLRSPVRKVWNGLVPYGEVWRGRANENTTLPASSPFKIGGKTLPAGSYGLHSIPGEKEWTVIVSTMSVAWKLRLQREGRCALRFTVTPTASEFTERLEYRFADPTDTSVTLVLQWEKLALPIKLEVDTPAVVMASMRAELRGGQQFNWAAWNAAANYWLKNGGAIDEAQTLADRAVNMVANYQTLTTVAAVAEKKGDKKLAADKRKEAEPLATEGDINTVAYGLLGQKKIDEAISAFQKNAQRHPTSWNVYDSLAEAYATKGDAKLAIDNYGKALKLVKDEDNRKRIEQTIARLKIKNA